MLSIQLSSDVFSWVNHTERALVMVTKRSEIRGKPIANVSCSEFS